MEHFGDEDTEFEIVRSDVPLDVDGFKIGEPTGEIRCLECGQQHQNIDEIEHEPDCPQEDVHSYYYVRQQKAAGE